MSYKPFYNVTPAEHIMNMFRSTVNGKLTLNIRRGRNQSPVGFSFGMKWTEADAEALVCRHRAFVHALMRIKHGDDCGVRAKDKGFLTPAELEAWNLCLCEPSAEILSTRWHALKNGESRDVWEMLYMLTCNDHFVPYGREIVVGGHTYPKYLVRLVRMLRGSIAARASREVINDILCLMAENLALYYYCIE